MIWIRSYAGGRGFDFDSVRPKFGPHERLMMSTRIFWLLQYYSRLGFRFEQWEVRYRLIPRFVTRW